MSLKALALKLLGALLFLTAIAMWWSRAPDWPVEALVARWAPAPSQFIDLDAQLVHLRDEGPRQDSLPLVLLHGTSSSLHTWEGWVKGLRAQRRVISVDLPGFGLTGPNSSSDYRGDAYARFVLALMDKLGVQRFVLGGNSLGGEVAWRTALLAPQRVAGLILVDAGGQDVAPASMPIGFMAARVPVLNRVFDWVLPRSLVVASLRNVYGDPTKVDEALVERHYQLTLREGNRRALVQRFQQSARGQDAARIQELRVPTLILWGGRDQLIPPAAAALFKAHIAGSELVEFDDLGHVPHEEARRARWLWCGTSCSVAHRSVVSCNRVRYMRPAKARRMLYSGPMNERSTAAKSPIAEQRDVPPLTRQFDEVRRQTLALIEPLSAEDCQLQSMPDASPAKWHLAHTTWFFETFVLEPFEPHFVPFDATFRVLFNSYYQGVGPQHPRAARGLLSRPGLDQVLAYRSQVESRLRALLQTPDAEVMALVTLGLNHEQQHQELLVTDIKHALSLNPSHPARPAYGRRWPIAQVHAQALRWLAVPGGLIQIGHEPGLDGEFHFDNEGPRHQAFLRNFELASRPVSYGDFQHFIADNGYARPELWLSMGWDWVCAGQRHAPLYWQADGRSTYTLHGSVAIDAHTPLPHLSYFEADAYARWAGARLPTEAEWEHAARHFVLSPAQGHYAEQRVFHPLPAEQATGVQPLQMFGDVWEWTQSAYAAHPGYRAAAGAVGEYNGKFMCNQYVLRGGSCATPAGHVRASYRNFFPPDAQWQFSGLRLARDVR